ncbi:uncharacterized protein LOC132696887 isoform X2 [Cylas formicarius]|uniref:uncharacterized protein LOC132696887 isoform X2 n=1 Tax=Cylas formicarius TaxID=197179 RepID=UPI002958AB50|nr:uncharacterized protein LOC132696887 isoform X2 [Cylas formicarius]
MEGKSSDENRRQVRYAESIEEECSAENVSENSKSLVRHSGDSEYSVGTSILDAGHQEVAVLKLKLEAAERKCRVLETENEKIHSDLIKERTKTAKQDKKLQFVKENQEIFMRLKEAYVNMKYNEAAGRRMIEIKEKGTQTWPGVLCNACLETEEVRRQVEILVVKYSQMFVVSPSEMERLVNTVKYLKDLVIRQEKTWLTNVEKQNVFQARVDLLTRENSELREMLTRKRVDNIDNQSTLGREILFRNVMDDQFSTKHIETLNKIIVKYERCHKLMTGNQTKKILNGPLSEKEQRIVEEIVSKCGTNCQKKSFVELTSNSASRENTALLRRPSGSLRCLNVDSKRFGGDSLGANAASTILMMDCLFD